MLCTEKAPTTGASCLPLVPKLTNDDGLDHNSRVTMPVTSSR
jgi:hypothetical protein